MTLLNPQQYPSLNNASVVAWRQRLKKALLVERDYRSDWSGTRLIHGAHMHEGIISRAVIPKSVWWHYYIYHPFNCFLLTPEEHIPHPPSREWAVAKSFERYGEDAVRSWFYTLPWKSAKPHFRI